jgi:translation initiation factor 2B subunit (eIF-2B alpha/beta/delta family)
VNPVLERRMQELRDDRRHGASWLARRALEILAEAVRAGEDPVETARALASARLSLGAVAGAVGRVLSAGTPEQVIAEAEAVISSGDRAAKAIAVLLEPDIAGVVLTHSASATVREALRHTPPERVICTVSEPGREGAELAHTLRVGALEVELIEDAEAAAAVSRAGLFLVGADTVFRDGSLVNKVGTAAIARAAKAAGVPVIVASETFKLAPFEPVPPTEERFELIPAALVDRIVTEEGAVEPGDVAALIDRTPCLTTGYKLLRGRRSRLRSG